MKRVQSITKNAAVRVMDGSAPMPVITAPLGTVDDQTGEVVEKLFRQLQAIFPAHKQAWPDDKALDLARRSWTKGFMAAGICTIEHIRYGIEQCRLSGSPFAPNIGQFIEWCTPGPEHFGMPPAADAWMQALMGIASHEAVTIAAQATGIFDLRKASQSDKPLRERFERNYEIVLRRAQAGQALDGRIAEGIGHDSAKTELELANELAERRVQERIVQQGIPAKGESARTALLAKLNIRREGHA